MFHSCPVQLKVRLTFELFAHFNPHEKGHPLNYFLGGEKKKILDYKNMWSYEAAQCPYAMFLDTSY